MEEVESALWDGIDSQWGLVFGINVYRNGPQSADGIIPVIVGEWGRCESHTVDLSISLTFSLVLLPFVNGLI